MTKPVDRKKRWAKALEKKIKISFEKVYLLKHSKIAYYL